MTIFATEFPIKSTIKKEIFVAASLAWIRGIKKSTVLEENMDDLRPDDALLESPNGEILQFKHYHGTDAEAFGVRHDLPDHQGRIWRTECVVNKLENKAFLRVKGQCVTTSNSAVALKPKKPHLITLAVEEGWGALDSRLPIQDHPHVLLEEDMSFLVDVLNGTSNLVLPVVYLSRNNDNTLSVNAENLARRLSGVAHVVLEPSRAFSFELMKVSNRKNPYGGAVGVFLNGIGESRRIQANIGERLRQISIDEIINEVTDLTATSSASNGWEWGTLHERQTRALRQQLKTPTNQNDELYIGFISELENRIKLLEEERDELKAKLVAASVFPTYHVESPEILPSKLVADIGSELYPGEFADRLRQVLLIVDQVKLGDTSKRTAIFLKKFLENTKFSNGAVVLSNQIRSAGRDGSAVERNIGNLLESFGFSKSVDGKHIKYFPPERFFGLSMQVLPSTPSDSQRGGMNKATDIVRDFDLNLLR